MSPVSNVTRLVIKLLNVELTVSILLKIQGNLTGFVIGVDHPGVGDSLQEGRSMRQLRSLKPSLMTNLI